MSINVVIRLVAECKVNPISPEAPLIVSPSNTSIIYPLPGKKSVRFKKGDRVQFACPKREVVADGKKIESLVTASCNSDGTFNISGKNYEWTQLVCSDNPVAVARFLNSKCAETARMSEIGFDIGDNLFISLISICFDTVNQITLYAYYDLTASIKARDSFTSRPVWAQDKEFYNVEERLNRLYSRAKQQKTINSLLGIELDSTKYIDRDKSFYLVRGHLVAKTDLFTAAEQNATFRYINAAPQWHSFNNGNWLRVEKDTRKLASKAKTNLQVWTGTYGVASLPHKETGEDTPLYIYVEEETRGIPIPAILWKLVYNPISRHGIVLIGINNPYESNVTRHIICPDVSSEVEWITWKEKKEETDSGYSYACTFDSFKKVVDYAPDIIVTDLLQ